MLFKKKNKKYKYNVEEYAYYIINCLSASEKNFFQNNKTIKYNLFSQTLYYLYYLYICEQILSSKYANEISNEIILKSCDIILERQSKSQINKSEFQNNMFCYLLYLKSEEIKINVKNDLQKLAKQFLEDNSLNPDDAIMILNIFTSFSTFIVYHSKDILNENIILI